MTTVPMLRAFEPSDMVRAADLCSASCVHDDHLAAALTALLRVPRLATVAVVGPTLVGLGIASLGYNAATTGTEAGNENEAGFIDLIAVEPQWQGRGVGTQLLVNAERELYARGCTRARAVGNAPFYVWPGVDARYIRAIGLFEDHGYRRANVEMTMSVELTGPQLRQPDAPEFDGDGVVLRSADRNEAHALRAALTRTWKPDWVDELEAAFVTPHAGVEVAVREGRYVGFCAYGVNRPGEVGPLGTTPELRGKGIGTALIRRALRAVAADGHAVGDIPWAGPLSLFARTLGASVSRVFIGYTKQLP